MATLNLNYASIGNTILIIGGLIATYLTSIGYLKEAGLVTLIALIIKGIFSEIDNQKSGTTYYVVFNSDNGATVFYLDFVNPGYTLSFAYGPFPDPTATLTLDNFFELNMRIIYFPPAGQVYGDGLTSIFC